MINRESWPKLRHRRVAQGWKRSLQAPGSCSKLVKENCRKRKKKSRLGSRHRVEKFGFTSIRWIWTPWCFRLPLPTWGVRHFKP